MNVLKADYWAYFASIFPIVVFFVVILIAYTYANAFGVSLTYLGVITFYQMIQFFENFKNIHYFYIGKTKPFKLRYFDGWTVRNLNPGRCSP